MMNIKMAEYILRGLQLDEEASGCILYVSFAGCYVNKQRRRWPEPLPEDPFGPLTARSRSVRLLSVRFLREQAQSGGEIVG